MAKTVFGMPGAGKVTTGSDTGSQGGSEVKTGGSLSESEQRRSPGATQAKPGTAGMAASRTPMSKSHNVPMAKPAFAKPIQGPKPAATSGRTVFGMPAVKIPTGPEPTPTPSMRSADLATTQAVSQVKPRPTGAGLPAAKTNGAEFNETMLGVAAITHGEVSPKSVDGGIEAFVESPTAAIPKLADEPSVGNASANEAAALMSALDAAWPADTSDGAVASESQPEREIPSYAPAETIGQMGLNKPLKMLVLLAIGLTIVYFVVSSILPRLLFSATVQDATQMIQNAQALQAQVPNLQVIPQPTVPTPPQVPPMPTLPQPGAAPMPTLPQPGAAPMPTLPQPGAAPMPTSPAPAGQ